MNEESISNVVNSFYVRGISAAAETYYLRMFKELAPVNTREYKQYVAVQKELYNSAVRTCRQ